MGSGRVWNLLAFVVVATLLSACDVPAATGDPTPGATSVPTPTWTSTPLALTRGGAILHAGHYCPSLQVASPGNNTLPVVNGCVFSLTKPPVDLFATDTGNYSVSEVVGDAELGVSGPPDARVMIVCRLSPIAQFWFWISSDGHWNVAQVDDIHNPQDLVSADQSEQMRQFVKLGGTRNVVQFKCAGGAHTRVITLAVNVNAHQFAALTVPMPVSAAPLARPSTPWFVDVGARLSAAGSLDGVVAKVTLYDHE